MKAYRKLQQAVPELTVIIGLIVLMIATNLVNNNFLTFTNITTMLKSIPFIALTALGIATSIQVAEIDICVGRLAGMCGMVFGLCLTILKLSLPVSILLGVGAGFLMGIINAVLAVEVGINSFVVTMGTLYIAGGIRYIINNGDPMTLPESYRKFTGAAPLGVSWFFWIVVLIYIIYGLLQKYTVYGRQMYAVGSNKEVAKLQGVNVKLIKMSAFVISGTLAGLAGVFAAIDINSCNSASGTGWEFKNVAACCIGGISLSGGAGRAFGVALGVFVVFIINNIINMMAISNYYSDVFTGCILLGAVLIDVIRKSRKIKAEAD